MCSNGNVSCYVGLCLCGIGGNEVETERNWFRCKIGILYFAKRVLLRAKKVN